MKFSIIMLFVAFIEGGALMAFEIISSKIYTPYLGSSVYVWTSILTVTLSGLALGYRIGGKNSSIPALKRLIVALVISSLTISLSVFISAPILEALLNVSVKTASILAGLCLIFIPVTAMGTVSPLISDLISNKGRKNAPETAGMVYGIGTIGGIVLLLVTTFVLIPEIGVKNSTFCIASLLMATAFIPFFIRKKYDE